MRTSGRLKLGQVVTEVVQAINRIRSRKVIDAEGNCPQADVYLMLPDGPTGVDVLEGVVRLMPGIKVREWELQTTMVKRRRGRRTGSGNAQAAILTHLRNMWTGRASVSAIKADLRLSDNTLKRFITDAKDAATDVAKALASYGVSFKVEGQGRGARYYFVKA